MYKCKYDKPTLTNKQKIIILLVHLGSQFVVLIPKINVFLFLRLYYNSVSFPDWSLMDFLKKRSSRQSRY